MKAAFMLVLLALPGTASAGLTCAQVVAGMRGELPLASPETLATLVEGAGAKQLAVEVRYRSRRWAWSQLVTIRAFVIGNGPEGFVLQTDDGTSTVVAPADLRRVEVLELPRVPELDEREQRALDSFREASESSRVVTLSLPRHDGFFVQRGVTAPDRFYVQGVRPSTDGGWIVDLRLVRSGPRRTVGYRLEAILEASPWFF